MTHITSPKQESPHGRETRAASGKVHPQRCTETGLVLNSSFASLCARPNPSSILLNRSGPPHLFSHRCLHAKQRSLELPLGVLVLEPPRFANEAARRDLAGRGVEEVQALAQGCCRWPRQRTSCQPSPSPRREQQAELAGLPAAPDEGRMSSPQGHPDGALVRSKQSVEPVSEVPGTDRQELAVHSRDGDGTEEDADNPEDLLLSLPSELSVLERLGLHRVALTEQDVEAAFAHLALAFRCDVFTLRQRMQVEKRARDAAEDNIQEELGQCRAALERLGPSCTDAGCKEMLEQLQHSLAVLAAAVERATGAAEKLGAVHQEARMSRAAEVMVQHVENLKRHHRREHAELEEMKRLIQQNSRNRQLAETQDDTEPRQRPHPLMRTFQQGSARRRVSIAVIPKQLLPGASPDSQAASAGEPEREGAQRRPSTQRSKGSAAELWRPWLFLPQHYWVFFWLLLLSIAFLLLLRILELQRLQPAASPKA
ncbi:inositol 1,4,5-triphosphate receptor associated 2-like isoform X2 [Tyto alba]|uniref:inositol 1,4,5-triphosphate receptor associated 2-like isoform X2 n=1 Tax=Tyto alba TaxID=56313 RepID=UPI001C6744BC|nr:inositol 1,4,5-triphosphate receptor associated 2-like isoform X2 [Tyto alba]